MIATAAPPDDFEITMATVDPEELLAAVVGHGLAVVPVADLAERWDWSRDEIDDAADELVSRGILSLWPESPDGPAIVLTVHAAYELGLEIDDAGCSWQPRGAKPKPFPASRSSKREIRECDLSDAETSMMGRMPDLRAMAPEKVADWHEANERNVRRAEEAKALPAWSRDRADRMHAARTSCPMLLLLLGLGVQWPVEFVAGSRCPVCRETTAKQWICLVCNCSSLDSVVGAPPSEATLTRQAARFEVAGRKLAGGLGSKPKAKAG
jgi:hypothetical protein